MSKGGWGLGVVGRGVASVRSLHHLARTIRATKTSVTPACLRCMRLSFTVTASYNRSKHSFFRHLYQVSPGCRHRRTRQMFSGTLRARHKRIRLNATFRLTRTVKMGVYVRRVFRHPANAGNATDATRGFPTRANTCGGMKGGRVSRRGRKRRRLLPNDRPRRRLPAFPRGS